MFYKGKRSGLLTLAQSNRSYTANKQDDLLRHHKIMQQLEEIFHQIIPAEFRSSATLAQYKNGELSVFCNNAASASSIKYSADEYIQLLRQYPQFRDLESIQVRIQVK